MSANRTSPLSTRGERPASDTDQILVPVVDISENPTVDWYTPRQFEQLYGYPYDAPETVVHPRTLEELGRERQLRLTEPRMDAFHRLARLWNGEAVRHGDVHLLADAIPSWSDVFGDLDQGQLEAMKTTVTPADEVFVQAFSEYDWATTEHRNRQFLKPTTILRRTVEYDLEERCRTLINERDEFPSLVGDPHEGLKHRVSVGLEVARATFEHGREVETYVDFGINQYTVDIVEREVHRTVLGEVLTDHNNNRLYRSTMAKLVDIGLPAVLVFDSRSTLRRVCNHWYDRGYDVPGAPFTSAPRMGWLREKFHDAAHDNTRDWVVEDVFTITQLWDQVFAEDPPRRRDVIALNW
ncbi:hypothetical protein [Haloprofundus halobius]|uniref:hypothetical protein n=1 Tax=Haloprofundus halobius TaxID=2876194 RepID=UPI001CCF3FF1|nr:hypothetical protein [Haloprofundus halobius]